MIYNRYIPGSNGIYKRHSITIPDETTHECSINHPVAEEKKTSEHQMHYQTSGIDLGDILLLCIVILLISESDGDDILPILAAVAAFFFIQ